MTGGADYGQGGAPGSHPVAGQPIDEEPDYGTSDSDLTFEEKTGASALVPRGATPMPMPQVIHTPPPMQVAVPQTPEAPPTWAETVDWDRIAKIALAVVGLGIILVAGIHVLRAL